MARFVSGEGQEEAWNDVDSVECGGDHVSYIVFIIGMATDNDDDSAMVIILWSMAVCFY